MLKFTIQGLKELEKNLKAEERRVMNSMAKAHSKVASQAVKVLKTGLSTRMGRKPSDKNYATSPQGALPFMHTGGLRDSIGFKLLRKGNKVFSEVGSGANDARQVEYAKYLEGRNNDGIRPFLWSIEKIYTADNIISLFNQYYKASK